MSYYDFQRSKEIAVEPFYGIIMAAMRNADDNNLEKLRRAFPNVFEELRKRYNAPGGCLSYEEFQRFHSDSSLTREIFEAWLKK